MLLPAILARPRGHGGEQASVFDVITETNAWNGNILSIETELLQNNALSRQDSRRLSFAIK